MRLPIENWVDTQGFNLVTEGLFRESIICYKASAYKAALLFSFLGYQHVIKDRILNAEKPGYYHDHNWEAMKRDLRKEEAWDIAVNEAIKKSDSNKKVFNISEDLRQQSAYWKNRRNDCAHSKPNIINSSHVEAFWFFLISNLSKFVVEGGHHSLKEKIKRHFDINYTREDADFMHLIREIPNAVQDDDIDEFIIFLNEIFEDNEYFYPIGAFRAYDFFNEMINLENSIIGRKVIEFIKTDEDLEINFIAEYPDKITRFYNSDPSGIRNLWRVKLDSPFYRKLDIFTALLANGLLESEKDEALSFFIRNNKNVVPKDSQIQLLKYNDYFTVYKEIVFANDNPLINIFDWGNHAIKSLLGHLDIMDLDEDIVRCINKTFRQSPYPNKLQKALKEYFTERHVQRDRYIEICESIGIEPSQNIIIS